MNQSHSVPVLVGGLTDSIDIHPCAIVDNHLLLAAVGAKVHHVVAKLIAPGNLVQHGGTIGGYRAEGRLKGRIPIALGTNKSEKPHWLFALLEIIVLFDLPLFKGRAPKQLHRIEFTKGYDIFTFSVGIEGHDITENFCEGAQGGRLTRVFVAQSLVDLKVNEGLHSENINYKDD